jgi:hypothetical protein
MPFFLGRGLILALAAGAAGGAAATLLRQNKQEARLIAKSAARAGLLMFEQARASLGEFGETAADVLAEAQAELLKERATQSSAEHVVPFEQRSSSDQRSSAEAEREAHG